MNQTRAILRPTALSLILVPGLVAQAPQPSPQSAADHDAATVLRAVKQAHSVLTHDGVGGLKGWVEEMKKRATGGDRDVLILYMSMDYFGYQAEAVMAKQRGAQPDAYFTVTAHGNRIADVLQKCSLPNDQRVPLYEYCQSEAWKDMAHLPIPEEHPATSAATVSTADHDAAIVLRSVRQADSILKQDGMVGLRTFVENMQEKAASGDRDKLIEFMSYNLFGTILDAGMSKQLGAPPNEYFIEGAMVARINAVLLKNPLPADQRVPLYKFCNAEVGKDMEQILNPQKR